MELKLMLQAPSGTRSEVVVESDPDAPAGALVEELCRFLELPPGAAESARVERSGAWLDAETPLGRVGLRDGDLLVFGTPNGASRHVPTAPAEPARFDLIVMAGPDAGTRLALPAGRHVVGRGPGADVVLSDRSMSRRHLVVDVAHTAVIVSDAGSSNGSFVDGDPLFEPREMGTGAAVEAGRSLLSFEPHATRGAPAVDAAGTVRFNRPPRIAWPPLPGRIAVAAPPADVEKARLPLGAALIPLALGGLMYALTGSPFAMVFALLTPAMALYSHMEGRGRNRRAHGDALRAWREQLDEAEEALRTSRASEVEQRRAAAPDATALRAAAGALDPALWERRPGDDDFLALRVGTADLDASAQPELTAGGDTALRREAEERLHPGATLPNVPVVVPLADGALGLAGGAAPVGGLARWLVAQAAVLHSPRELEIAVAVDTRRAAEWSWVKWLPHVRGESPAVGMPAAQELLERARGPVRRLIVIDGELGLAPNVVEELRAAGDTAIWLARERRTIPGACTAIAEVAEDVAVLAVVDVRSGAAIEGGAADAVSAAWAEELARMLAPIRDAGDAAAEVALPRRVSLLDLLELSRPTPAAVQARWDGEQRSLEAPIGLTADGPFMVDAGQVEGLRMLLAGMPGTGKSELLQTLIGALAATHPPSRLTFLLVDYKGGAAFGDCARLPHTVGLVTDLDSRLADRARTSLLAELRRRERLLKDAGAKSLRELARRTDDAPPALVIVVDEFAALVREVPAFLDTLVDVAQRGRSLGLHLVLATQRPRGTVSDALRANTNLRMAMRVSDESESRDVLESPAAAAIPAGLPGRAIALTGRGPAGAPELVELQVAYAGGRTTGGLGSDSRVRVRAMETGAPQRALERVLSSVGGDRPTDLQVLVACAREAAERAGNVSPRPPWLPPLPARVDLSDLPPGDPAHPVFGLIDDPHAQSQSPLALDLNQAGGIVFYGAAQSGRTAALKTLACALVRTASPEQLQVYGIDCASRELAALEELPHVGSIINADDDERVLRLLGGLTRAVDERREKLAGGARPGQAGFPRLLLLVDGYAGFTAAFERMRYGEPLQALARLAADGRPVGIHVALTAERRADVPGALAGVLGERVVLRLAGEDEYGALGVPRVYAGAQLPPGRGLTHDAREVQLAFVDDEALTELSSLAAEAHPGLRAQPVGRLPTRVPRSTLRVPAEPLQAAVGIDGERLQPAIVSLADQHVLVAGAARSGISTALGTIATSLRAGTPELRLCLLAPRRTPLLDLHVWDDVARGPDACCELAARLVAEGAEPLVVVLDDGIELAEGSGAAPIEALLRRARDEHVRLVAGVDAHAVARVFGGWLRDVRNGRSGLLLQPADGAGDILGTRLPGGAHGMPPGRGYHVQRGVARLVQVAGP